MLMILEVPKFLESRVLMYARLVTCTSTITLKILKILFQTLQSKEFSRMIFLILHHPRRCIRSTSQVQSHLLEAQTLDLDLEVLKRDLILLLKDHQNL